MAYVTDVKQGCLVAPLRCVTLHSIVWFDRAVSRIYILVSYYLRNILFILAWVNTMSHGREKQPHGMNARCERYGIAYLVICGRSKVIWRVTAQTPGHFGHVFCTFYIYSLFIICIIYSSLPTIIALLFQKILLQQHLSCPCVRSVRCGRLYA